MNNRINNISPQFRATTIINAEKNLLSQDEIKLLTKMGEKIGVPSDTISFSVRSHSNDSIGIAHKTKFNLDNGGTLQHSHAKVMAKTNISPFNYIRNKMAEFKSLYENSF